MQMTEFSTAFLGQTKEELDTPVLLVNLDIFEANMAGLVQFCRAHETDWRPHSKSHKSPKIARLQLEAGAVGITCAKLSEAELMVAHGIGPILIANQVVTPNKLNRLAALQRHQEVIAAVDDPGVVSLLGQAARDQGVEVPVFIELDIGMDRGGAQPGQPVLELAREITAISGLSFRGLMGWEGHVLALQPFSEKERACHQALDLLLESRDLLQANGIEVGTISAGGTGCFEITAAYPGITETQAGGGIFMDAMYSRKFQVQSLRCGLTVLATVTSRSDGHVIVDAGFKTMSAYHHSPVPIDRDDLELRYLSAEHGIFDIREGFAGPQIGERIEFLVGYGDSTTFLHDRFLGLREDRVEEVWEILGRGKLT